MALNEKNLIDLKFAALRFVAAMDRKCVDELMTAGIISHYRDLCGDIDEIKEKVSKNELSERTRERIELAFDQSKVNKVYEAYQKEMEDKNIGIIADDDDDYPWAWRQLSGMPPVFFYKGNKELLKQCHDKGAVAMVGSRQPSAYGMQATKDFADHLAQKGVVIVSGMAKGIDRGAHAATLNSKGATIAIVPGGVDVIYPPENQDLYKVLCDRGLIISELPPMQTVNKRYFPARNRLIAGLSDITLIMEAGEYSGTLHTASFAASQGKDVFVLPHAIYSQNVMGGLYLIRDGAEILTDKESIDSRIAECLLNRLGDYCQKDNIEELREMSQKAPDKLEDDQWQELILDKLTVKPMTFDELSEGVILDFTKLSVLLADLEKRQKVLMTEGKYSLTFQR